MVKLKKKAKQSTINNQQLTTKLSWLPKKTFELEFEIQWPQVKKSYDETLKKIATETTIKGFRKGKAPLNLVEKQIDKAKIYQEVIKKLLPISYVELVKKHNLRPIVDPKVQPISVKENEAWQFKAISCEAPEVKLGDYQKDVKGAFAQAKIWLPGKENSADKTSKATPEQSYDEKLKLATAALLKNVSVEIPDILAEDEVNKMLTRLLDQIDRLGMTIDQYLSSKNMTSDQLKNEYRKIAEDTWKMEFILAAIIKDRAIKIEEKEVEQMIKVTPDEAIRKKLETPEQKAYIAHILAKRKVIDFLLSL